MKSGDRGEAVPDQLIPTSRAYDYASLSVLLIVFSLTSMNSIRDETDFSVFFILFVILSIAFYTIALPVIQSRPTDSDCLNTVPFGDKIRFRITENGNTRAVDLLFRKYIIISKKDNNRPTDSKMAIIYHEYAHLYYNDARLFQLTTIVYFSIIAQWIAIFAMMIFWPSSSIVRSLIFQHELRDFYYWQSPVIGITYGTYLIILSSYLYKIGTFNREINADYVSFHFNGEYIYSVLKIIKRRNDLEKNSSRYYFPMQIIRRLLSNITHPPSIKRIEFQYDKNYLMLNNPIISAIITTNFFALFLLLGGLSDHELINNQKQYYNFFQPINNEFFLGLIALSTFFAMSFTSTTIQNLIIKKIRYGTIIYVSVYCVTIFIALVSTRFFTYFWSDQQFISYDFISASLVMMLGLSIFCALIYFFNRIKYSINKKLNHGTVTNYFLSIICLIVAGLILDLILGR